VTHLNEWRALRDAYALKAAAALARQRPALSHGYWLNYCHEVKASPLNYADALNFLAEEIGDMTDWSAITRFAFLADAVWGLECDEMVDRMNYTYAQARRFAAA